MDWKIDLIQEMSFQGGDGYQYFMNHDLAFAAISRIAEFCYNDSSVKSDALYDSVDFGIEFVNTIKNFNTEIMDDPNYAALLNVFGSNLTHSTGSRSVKRHIDFFYKDTCLSSQSDKSNTSEFDPSTTWNASKLSGGVGRFIGKDQKKFVKIYNNSERFKKNYGYSATCIRL